MDITSLTRIVLGLSLLSVLASARAQAPADTARQRFDNDQILRELSRENAIVPSFYSEEESDVGPQSVVRARPRQTWFDVSLDSQLYYTDNLYYQERDKTNSSVFVNTAQFAITPPSVDIAGGPLRPRVGYRHQWYNYGLVESDGDKNNFNFDAQTVFGDASWHLENWQAQVGLEWTRLLGHEPDYFDYDQFYSEYSPHWSLHRVFPVHERLTFLAGYLGSYHFSDVDPTPGLSDEDRNDRWDHVLFLHGSYSLSPQWVAQPYYRLQFSDYTQQSREDFLHSFGLSVGWLCNQYASLRAFVGYDMLESTDSLVADYRTFNTGGGINLKIKF